MNDCDEHVSIYNGHFELQLLIERPIAQVWRKYLDLDSWITSHDIQYAYGTAGTVGSIMRTSFRQAKELAMPLPHYHYCKFFKLVPERQCVIKTYSEKGGSYGMRMTGFDDTRFVAANGSTRVTFNIFIEIESATVKEDPAAMSLDASREGMQKNLDNLKRVLES